MFLFATLNVLNLLLLATNSGTKAKGIMDIDFKKHSVLNGALLGWSLFSSKCFSLKAWLEKYLNQTLPL